MDTNRTAPAGTDLDGEMTAGVAAAVLEMDAAQQALDLHHERRCPSSCCPDIIKNFGAPHGHNYPGAGQRHAQTKRLASIARDARHQAVVAEASVVATQQGYDSLDAACEQMVSDIRAVADAVEAGELVTSDSSVRRDPLVVTADRWLGLFKLLRTDPHYRPQLQAAVATIH